MLEPDVDPPQAPADDRLPPLARVIFYLPAFLIANLVTATVVVVLWAELSGQTVVQLAESGGQVALALGISVAFFPVLLLGTWLFARGLDHRSLADLGWRWPTGVGRTSRQLLWAMSGAAVLFGAWLFAGRVGFTLNFGGWAELGQGTVPTASRLLLLFLGFLVAAAVEELGFRGYVFHALKERATWASAAGLQAVLFAALHASNPEMSAAGLLNTFLLGLALAAVVEATGSLFAATIAHATWNFLVVLGLPLSGLPGLGVVKLALSGPAGWTGGAYGPEGSWLLSGLLVVLVFALALWADRVKSETVGASSAATLDGP